MIIEIALAANRTLKNNAPFMGDICIFCNITPPGGLYYNIILKKQAQTPIFTINLTIN